MSDDNDIDWPEHATLPLGRHSEGQFGVINPKWMPVVRFNAEPTKEKLFEAMPDIRVVNDDGTEMQWKCINNVWHWKHVAAGGLVLDEGEGAP